MFCAIWIFIFPQNAKNILELVTFSILLIDFSSLKKRIAPNWILTFMQNAKKLLELLTSIYLLIKYFLF